MSDAKPRLITHVETSRAGNGDVDVTPLIHQALQEKALLPTEHLTDTKYAEAKPFLHSQQDYGIDLIAPTRADHKWQAQQQQGFDANNFQIDWQAHTATCPAGHTSLSWTPAIDRRDNQVSKIKFSRKDGLPCALRPQCTRVQATSDHASGPRRCTWPYSEPEHGKKSLPFGRSIAGALGWKARSRKRVRAFSLRRSRYEGAAKTHLQHLACAAALNVVRVASLVG